MTISGIVGKCYRAELWHQQFDADDLDNDLVEVTYHKDAAAAAAHVSQQVKTRPSWTRDTPEGREGSVYYGYVEQGYLSYDEHDIEEWDVEGSSERVEITSDGDITS